MADPATQEPTQSRGDTYDLVQRLYADIHAIAKEEAQSAIRESMKHVEQERNVNG